MNRNQVLAKLEQAWNSFRESYAGLSGEQLLQPGVVEDWSVKDLIAHVSWWEEESLKHLPHILTPKVKHAQQQGILRSLLAGLKTGSK